MLLFNQFMELLDPERKVATFDKSANSFPIIIMLCYSNPRPAFCHHKFARM